MSPADMLYKYRGGDPEAVFAVRAAVEAETRENERWEALFEVLEKLFDGYLGG